MCKFCNFEERDQQEPLSETKLNFGILNNRYNAPRISLSMEKWDGKTAMYAWITVGDTNVHAKKKINYCPFCGRNLNEQ